MDRPFDSSHQKRIVLSEARRVVDELLSLCDHPQDLGARLPEVTDKLSDYGELVFGPLIEAVDAKRGRQSVMAAWMLLEIEKQVPGFAGDRPALHRSELVMRTALLSEDVEFALWPCMLLGLTEPSAELLDEVAKRMKSGDQRMRIGAAMTVIKHRPQSRTAVKALLMALRGDDLAFIGVAAPVLASIPEYRAETVETLGRVMPESRGVDLQSMLFGVRGIVPPAVELLPVVARVVRDARVPAAARAYAAVTLGLLAGASVDYLLELLVLIRSTDPVLVLGGAEGLSRAGTIPYEAASLIAAHLPSPDAQLRKAAALGLVKLGGSASPAMQPLLERIGVERDLDTTILIGRSLMNIGVATVPLMIDMLRRRDILVASTVATAFQYLSPDGVRELAERMEMEEDEHVIATLAQVLIQLGVRAKPAIPQLDAILQTTLDGDRATAIMAVLLVMGPAALGAYEGVLRCLTTGRDEMAAVAERVLWNCGPPALANLHAARAEAEGVARSRIEQVITGFASTHRGRFAAFERFDNDPALRVVVFVASTMKANEPTTERALEDRVRLLKRKEELPANFPRAARAISAHVKDAELFFGELFAREAKTKVMLDLTPLGQSMLAEMRAYLAWKSAE